MIYLPDKRADCGFSKFSIHRAREMGNIPRSERQSPSDKPAITWHAVSLWTLDLVLSNKGPIWQATKIPAQAHLALCGGGRSLEHSNPKALLGLAGIFSPLRSGFPPPQKKKKKSKKKKKKKKEKRGLCLVQSARGRATLAGRFFSGCGIFR